MAGGIGGFAEGFSSGLGQGMGIIQSVRQDKRAEAYQKKQFEQMDHSMKLQDAQETRAQEAHTDQMETSKWTKDNLRPLQLKQTQLAVDKYAQDIEIGGVDLATKNLMLQWLPEDHSLEREAKRVGIQTAKNADRRADLSLNDQLANSSLNRQLAKNADTRAGQSQSIQLAGAVLPVYTEMLSRGIEPPKQMTEIIANSATGKT